MRYFFLLHQLFLIFRLTQHIQDPKKEFYYLMIEAGYTVGNLVASGAFVLYQVKLNSILVHTNRFIRFYLEIQGKFF
jgi:hypothetical protein